MCETPDISKNEGLHEGRSHAPQAPGAGGSRSLGYTSAKTFSLSVREGWRMRLSALASI